MIIVNKFLCGLSSFIHCIDHLLVAMSHDFIKSIKSKISDFIAIVFMLVGCVPGWFPLVILSMFFLGIEILSISLYVLAASKRNKQVLSNEVESNIS
jgi:NADH-quinone oxidoreductase subunit N